MIGSSMPSRSHRVVFTCRSSKLRAIQHRSLKNESINLANFCNWPIADTGQRNAYVSSYSNIGRDFLGPDS